MVQDVLSSALCKAVDYGLLSGVKAKQISPLISHIFFVDDSLLFLKANGREVSILKDILRDYCVASGQLINFLKLEIFFSKRRDPDTKT